MTNPTEPVLAVEQCDRLAAEAQTIWSNEQREWVLAGKLDSNPNVQAFARHRLAATAALQAEIAARDAEIVRRLRGVVHELCAAIDTARNMVPDDDEGLAAKVFCLVLNSAQQAAHKALGDRP